MASMGLRQKLIKEIRLSMGEGMIRVELTPDHYELAVDLALDRYRQRSSNAVEERIAFLDLLEGQNEYFLPAEIIEVRQIFRRGITGTATGTGPNFDPFGAAFVNQFTIAGLGSAGDLVTYELFSEFENLLGRMFGYHIIFHWDSTTKRLDLQRNITGAETVMMWVFNYRPEDLIFQDTYARPWVRDYAIAKCNFMLGEAREKFATLGGPQGGVTLNGGALKAQALADMDRLEKEVSNQVDGHYGYGFTFG